MSETIPAEDLAEAEALDSASAAADNARDEPPRPKTVEEKAQLVDGVRDAHRAHKTAQDRRIQLEKDLASARVGEARALEALHSARFTLKLESEATE